MATTAAAMKGRLGNTDYYVLSMKARELVNRVTTPTKIKGWDGLSVEELYYRGISYDGVKTRIAPYLANDQSRFFGAVIVTAMNFDDAMFEPLSDVAGKGLPSLYRADAVNMGFLTFSGGEMRLSSNECG